MVNLPNFSKADAEPEVSNHTLKAGFIALKEEDYLSALAYFGEVQQAEGHTPTGTRAQMGMILAYERHGQPDLAYELCQALKSSPYRAASDWANKALNSLVKRYPELQPFTGNYPRRPESNAPSLTSQRPNRDDSQAADLSTLPTQMPSLEEHEALPKEPTIAPTLPPGSVLTTPEPAQPSTRIWKNADRLPKGKSLGKVKRFQFRLVKLGTAVLLIWLLFQGTLLAKACLVEVAGWLPFVSAIQLIAINITWPFFIGLAIIVGLSPWLTDWLLKKLYGWQMLPIAALTKQSPETLKVLNYLTHQKKITMPKLGILPTQAPLAFTYGYLPRNARIVVSQGLLDQLAPDEIATIYAVEVGHIFNGDFAVMSLVLLVLQFPYLIYWKSAALGDWLKARTEQTSQAVELKWQAIQHERQALQRGGHKPSWNQLPWMPYGRSLTIHGGLMLLLYGTALLSIVAYSLYWLLRLITLGLSKLRVSYSDRTAVELTGNPNGLMRALLKIAIGTATDIQTQGQTSHALECFDVLVPLSYRLGITLGSVPPNQDWESLLEWEQHNIYRQWLNVNHGQPLLGERLRLLASYAKHWQLKAELDFPAANTDHPISFFQRVRHYPLRTLLGWIPYLVTVFLQGAPLWGLPLGYTLGLSIWGIAWLLDLAGLREVGWIVSNPDILKASTMTGFSLSVFLWINPFFPEIKPADTRVTSGDNKTLPPQSAIVTDPNVILAMLADPFMLPSSSQPVRLEGKLLGRRGVSNLLGQDLILQTRSGLVKLHHLFQFGPLVEIWMQKTYPETLIGKNVLAIGWLRRGVTPWLDLDSLRTVEGKTSYSSHAVWFTTLACLTTLVASYIIINSVG